MLFNLLLLSSQAKFVSERIEEANTNTGKAFDKNGFKYISMLYHTARLPVTTETTFSVFLGFMCVLKDIMRKVTEG